MTILFSLIAGVVALWVTGVVVGLLVGWRRVGLARSIRRLVVWHLGGVVVLGLMLLDIRPCVTTPLMTTAEKSALSDRFDSDSDDDRYRIALTGTDIASGLRSAADWFRIELHSEVVFPGPDRFRLRFALGHPLGYLNGELDGTARVESGRLETRWDRLWVGRLPLVGWIRRVSQWLFCYGVEHDPIARKGLSSVVVGRIEDGQARFEVIRASNVIGTVATGFQSREMAEDAALAATVIDAWLERLERSESAVGSGPDGLVEGTRFLFSESQRQAPDRSVMRQNRAGILASAIWMGHARLYRLTGRVLPEAPYDRLVRTGGRVSVYGRNDLVRHFWVSAAITAFASARISTFAGISKEEMDSGEGGSGFSFCDLLADRAGVRFAEFALGAPREASGMQARIAGEWRDSDLIAPIDGLPEGLSQAEFTTEYGGVEGSVYRRWSDLIDQRVRSSLLLQVFRD